MSEHLRDSLLQVGLVFITSRPALVEIESSDCSRFARPLSPLINRISTISPGLLWQALQTIVGNRPKNNRCANHSLSNCQNLWIEDARSSGFTHSHSLRATLLDVRQGRVSVFTEASLFLRR